MEQKKIESILQKAFDQQDWLCKSMKLKAVSALDHKKKQQYLKASFAALGGALIIKQTASSLAIKINDDDSTDIKDDIDGIREAFND